VELLEKAQEKVESTEPQIQGEVLEILRHDNPLLREKSLPYVGDIVSDTETKQLIADMIATMQAAGAVGLAAIQVGVNVRILVVQDEKREPYVVINPAVQELDEEKVRETEGCLSYPGLFIQVWRPASVVIKCLSGTGEPVTIAADKLLGRAILHEIDHLDGVLFVDRIPKVMRQGLTKKMEVHERQLKAFIKNKKEQQAKLQKLIAKYQRAFDSQPKAEEAPVTEPQEPSHSAPTA
jgi:peptide deformylase